METQVSREASLACLRDGEALLVGDVVVSRDGNALHVSRPAHSLYYIAPTINDAEDVASGHTCGPWHIDGIDGYFPTLAEAAQHAELMVDTAGGFARRVLVRDKWQRVAYEAKGGES